MIGKIQYNIGIQDYSFFNLMILIIEIFYIGVQRINKMNHTLNKVYLDFVPKDLFSVIYNSQLLIE